MRGVEWTVIFLGICLGFCSGATEESCIGTVAFQSKLTFIDVLTSGNLAFPIATIGTEVSLGVSSTGDSRFILENVGNLGQGIKGQVDYSPEVTFPSKPKGLFQTNFNLLVLMENSKVSSWPAREEEVVKLPGTIDKVVGGTSFGLALSGETLHVWGSPKGSAALEPFLGTLEGMSVVDLWGYGGVFFVNLQDNANTSRPVFGSVFVDRSMGTTFGEDVYVLEDKLDQVLCRSASRTCLAFPSPGTSDTVFVFKIDFRGEVSHRLLLAENRNSQVVDFRGQEFSEQIVLLMEDHSIVGISQNLPQEAKDKSFKKLLSVSRVQRMDGMVVAWENDSYQELGIADDVAMLQGILFLLRDGKVVFPEGSSGNAWFQYIAFMPDGGVRFRFCDTEDSSRCALELDDGSFFFPAALLGSKPGLPFYSRRVVKGQTLPITKTASAGSSIALLQKDGTIIASHRTTFSCTGNYVLSTDKEIVEDPVQEQVFVTIFGILDFDPTRKVARFWSVNKFEESTFVLEVFNVRKVWQVSGYRHFFEMEDGTLELWEGDRSRVVLPNVRTMTTDTSLIKQVSMSTFLPELLILFDSGDCFHVHLESLSVRARWFEVKSMIVPSVTVYGTPAVFNFENGSVGTYNFLMQQNAPFPTATAHLRDFKCTSSFCIGLQSDSQVVGLSIAGQTLDTTVNDAVKIVAGSDSIAVLTKDGTVYLWTGPNMNLLAPVKQVADISMATNEIVDYLFVKFSSTGLWAVHMYDGGTGSRSVVKTFANVELAFFSTFRAFFVDTEGNLAVFPDEIGRNYAGQKFKYVHIASWSGQELPYQIWLEALGVKEDGTLVGFGSQAAEAAIERLALRGVSRVYVSTISFLAADAESTTGASCGLFFCRKFSVPETLAPTSAHASDTENNSIPFIVGGSAIAFLLVAAALVAFVRSRSSSQTGDTNLFPVVLKTDNELMVVEDGFQYDAFLTHDWGEDGSTHDAVSKINKKLQSTGLSTWFDEDRLAGNIAQQITSGIEASRKVVVFITERYMEKLQSEAEDYCRDEFLAACRVRGVKYMIPCVLEPTMLNVSQWKGPLQLKLAGQLYLDFSTTSKREANFPKLVAQLQ